MLSVEWQWRVVSFHDDDYLQSVISVLRVSVGKLQTMREMWQMAIKRRIQEAVEIDQSWQEKHFQLHLDLEFLKVNPFSL